MNQEVINIADLYIILLSGANKAQVIAIEFNAQNGYILMPFYRLN